MPASRPLISSRLQRILLFCGRRPLLLNAALLGMVCVLYGSLELVGHGRLYANRVFDFRILDEGEGFFTTDPGIENLLLPTLGAGARVLWTALGFEFTETTLVVFAAMPYALFIYGMTRHVSRRENGGRLLAMGTAIALYTSGMIPYMMSWGGYVDGLSYLLLLPLVIWPESLLVYVAMFVLQCLNHYLGAVAQLMFAFVWHSLRAIDRGGLTYWRASFLPRAVASVAILGAFMTFWAAVAPQAAGVRQAIIAQKWQDPQAALQQVLGHFPWTVLSALKALTGPVVVLMFAALPRRNVRLLVLGAPFLAAFALSFAFFDTTRVTTMVVMPALLVTLLVAGKRRPLRRLVVIAALLNLLIPNYYVHEGRIVVPDSQVIRWLVGSPGQP